MKNPFPQRNARRYGRVWPLKYVVNKGNQTSVSCVDYDFQHFKPLK